MQFTLIAEKMQSDVVLLKCTCCHNILFSEREKKEMFWEQTVLLNDFFFFKGKILRYSPEKENLFSNHVWLDQWTHSDKRHGPATGPSVIPANKADLKPPGMALTKCHGVSVEARWVLWWKAIVQPCPCYCAWAQVWWEEHRVLVEKETFGQYAVLFPDPVSSECLWPQSASITCHRLTTWWTSISVQGA